MGEKKIMNCIVGSSVRDIVKQSVELEIPKEDIVNMFVLNDQVYLIFYK